MRIERHTPGDSQRSATPNRRESEQKVTSIIGKIPPAYFPNLHPGVGMGPHLFYRSLSFDNAVRIPMRMTVMYPIHVCP
jgi:hypothetical protein